MAARHSRGACAAAALVVGLVTWVLALAPLAAAADVPATGIPTVTTGAADPNPVPADMAVTLTASVDPNPGGGTIVWVDVYRAKPETLGESPVEPATGAATLVATLEPGHYGIRAEFRGSAGFAPSSSSPVLVTVLTAGTPSTTTLRATPTTTELGEDIVLTATVNPPTGGLVMFMDGITNLSSELVDPDSGVATLISSRLRVGAHRLVATFVPVFADGSAASQSAPLIVTVTPPTRIRASGLGVSDAVFYPARDGFRDALGIRGRVSQPAFVTVEVLSLSSGKIVRTVPYGEKVGAYVVLWDGRDAAGRMLPGGRYRVVQRLRDAWGNTLAQASRTEISPKRLHWSTETRSRAGESADARDAYASALILRSRFPGGVQLDASAGDSYLDPSEAWLDFRFRLPRAAVYKKVSCAVLSATDSGRGPAALLLRDWKVVSAWDDEWDAVAKPATSYGWTTGKGDPKQHISAKGEIVCSVYVDSSNNGQIDVAKVKLTYTYGVLR